MHSMCHMLHNVCIPAPQVKCTANCCGAPEQSIPDLQPLHDCIYVLLSCCVCDAAHKGQESSKSGTLLYPMGCQAAVFVMQPIKVRTLANQVETAVMLIAELETSPTDLRAVAMHTRNPLHTFMFDSQGVLLNANAAALEAFQHHHTGLSRHTKVPAPICIIPPVAHPRGKSCSAFEIQGFASKG